MKTEKISSLELFEDSDKVGNNVLFWNYREVNTIIGTFLRWEEDGFGSHAVLMVNEDNKQEEVNIPNLVALNNRLKTGKVESGNKIKIVFLDEKKSKKSGRIYNDFDVFIKKG